MQNSEFEFIIENWQQEIKKKTKENRGKIILLLSCLIIFAIIITIPYRDVAAVTLFYVFPLILIQWNLAIHNLHTFSCK